MAVVAGWTRLTTSGKVATGPLALTGVIVNGSVSGAVVTLYNSLDENSNDIIAEIKIEGAYSLPLFFDWPIFIERGLYIKVGSNIDSVTVFWCPFRE
jgi:hypothetical protein